MVLFVGDEDMSKARQPAWPLARHGTADLFKPVPFGTDQRGRTVTVTLMFVSVSSARSRGWARRSLLRLLPLIAALDSAGRAPRCSTSRAPGTCPPWKPVAHRYRAGDDDEDIAYALADFRALREELRRRAKVIRELPRDVCPENKVTPELAADQPARAAPDRDRWSTSARSRSSTPTTAGEFEEICTDLIKRGPALGIDPDAGHPAARRQVAAHRDQRERGAAVLPAR